MNVRPVQHQVRYNSFLDEDQCSVCVLTRKNLTTHCLNRPVSEHELACIGEDWDFRDWAWVQGRSQRTDPITQPIPTCLNCARELSTYLDAYYGTDPVARGLCAGCRDARARDARAA